MRLQNIFFKPLPLMLSVVTYMLCGVAAVAAEVAEFNPTQIGTEDTLTQNLNKAVCPVGEELIKVQLAYAEANITTTLAFTNTTSNTDFADIQSVSHDFLSMTIGGLGAPYQIQGAPPSNSTSFGICTLNPGQNQSQCAQGVLPSPILVTKAGPQNFTLTPSDGSAFNFFKGPGIFPVQFKVGGRLQANVPITWQFNNSSPAYGKLTVTYTCEKPPALQCEYKTLTPNTLTGPDGTVAAQFKINNTGGVNFTGNLTITDTMGAKMTYLSGSPIPSGGPPTYTWSGLSLAQGNSLIVNYQAKITGLNSGEQVCNSVVATANGTTSNTCQACVSRGGTTVPAVTPLGLAGAALLLPWVGVFFWRRRQRL